MSGGKIAGGVLSLVGGGLFIIYTLIYLPLVNFACIGCAGTIEWFIILTICVLAIIGGIILLTGGSGGLSLAAGIIAVTAGLLYYFLWPATITDYLGIYYYSILYDIIGLAILGMMLESILILVGGIIGVASSSD